MNVVRGDVWLANLNPTQGSEQAGIRPVLVVQNNSINAYTTTIVTGWQGKLLAALAGIDTHD